jgi:hypothetical protein
MKKDQLNKRLYQIHLEVAQEYMAHNSKQYKWKYQQGHEKKI